MQCEFAFGSTRRSDDQSLMTLADDRLCTTKEREAYCARRQCSGLGEVWVKLQVRFRSKKGKEESGYFVSEGGGGRRSSPGWITRRTSEGLELRAIEVSWRAGGMTRQ